MEKYILTCEIENLKGFGYNCGKDYAFLVGLPKGEYVFIDCQTKEIEVSDTSYLSALEGNYKEVNPGA